MSTYCVSVLLSVLLASGTGSPAGDLVIDVVGLDERGGNVRVALFNDAEHHLGRAYRSLVVPARGERVEVRFEQLPEGRYSFAIVQDLDGNDRMTRGLFGLPTEPYVFSNDLGVGLGPPSWSRASFTLPITGLRLRVHLR